MKSIFTIQFFLLPTAVLANVGHIEKAFGHDHWLGAAAIGAAIALGLWCVLRGSKKAYKEEAVGAETKEVHEA